MDSYKQENPSTTADPVDAAVDSGTIRVQDTSSPDTYAPVQLLEQKPVVNTMVDSDNTLIVSGMVHGVFLTEHMDGTMHDISGVESLVDAHNAVVEWQEDSVDPEGDTVAHYVSNFSTRIIYVDQEVGFARVDTCLYDSLKYNLDADVIYQDMLSLVNFIVSHGGHPSGVVTVTDAAARTVITYGVVDNSGLLTHCDTIDTHLESYRESPGNSGYRVIYINN